MLSEVDKLKENLKTFLASYYTIMGGAPVLGAPEEAWWFFLQRGIDEYFKRQQLAPFTYVQQQKYRAPGAKMDIGDTIVGARVHLPITVSSLISGGYSSHTTPIDLYQYNNMHQTLHKPGNYMFTNSNNEQILVEIIRTSHNPYVSSDDTAVCDPCSFRITRMK